MVSNSVQFHTVNKDPEEAKVDQDQLHTNTPAEAHSVWTIGTLTDGTLNVGMSLNQSEHFEQAEWHWTNWNTQHIASRLTFNQNTRNAIWSFGTPLTQPIKQTLKTLLGHSERNSANSNNWNTNWTWVSPEQSEHVEQYWNNRDTVWPFGTPLNQSNTAGTLQLSLLKWLWNINGTLRVSLSLSEHSKHYWNTQNASQLKYLEHYWNTQSDTQQIRFQEQNCIK